MKMSLCNTFRLFALSLTFVLSAIGTPANAFTISRPDDISETIGDLEQAGSIRLEVRDDFRRPNDIGVTKGDRFTPTTETETKDYMFRIPLTTIEDQTSENSFGTSRSVDFTTGKTSAMPTIQSDDSDYKINTDAFTANPETTKNNEKSTTMSVISSTGDGPLNYSKADKYELTSHNIGLSEAQPFPSWKKYTIINRKHEGDLRNDLTKSDNRSEEMMTDETGHPLQDSKTGDIPSLNQIKNFLSFFKTDVQNDTASSKEVSEQSIKDNLGISQDLNTPTTTDKEITATVESKRGGFLDFSLKSLFEDNDDKKDNSQELNTSRPKNRKLSWRIGSRYRGKEDNSAEKPVRTRFRLRNDDDKNDRKKDKNDTKNNKESQEELLKNNKEIESKEEENDKSREKPRTKSNDDRKKEAFNRKKQESKEETLEKNENKNIKESNEENYKDRNDKVRFQSQSKNDKETSRESDRDRGREKNKSKTESGEEKTAAINIWKIKSKEDSSERFPSRSRNEKERPKERDGDRNEKSENKKGDRNRENKSSEKLQINESHSQSNEAEISHYERKKENTDEKNRSQSRNEENRSSDNRMNENTRDRYIEKNRSQSKNEEERSKNNRRKEISKDRDNDKTRTQNKEELRTKNDKRKDNTIVIDKERNGSLSKNEEERPDRRKENTRDRNSDKNYPQFSSGEESSYNDRRKEITIDRDSKKNHPQFNSGEERSNNDRRKENTRDRDSNKNYSQFNSQEDRSNNDRRKDNTRDRDSNKNYSQINSQEDRSNNDRRKEKTRDKDSNKNYSQFNSQEDRSNNDRTKEKTRDKDRDSNKNPPQFNSGEERSYNDRQIENTRDSDKNRPQFNSEEERSNNDRRKANNRDRDNDKDRSKTRNDKERTTSNRKIEKTDKNNKEYDGFNNQFNTEIPDYPKIGPLRSTSKESEPDIKISSVKIDVGAENKTPMQIQEAISDTRIQDEEDVARHPPPKLENYTKLFLSTIEEEDESETQSPTLLEDKTSTTKTKQTNLKNVAMKYPYDVKFNDMTTTQVSLEPNDPHKVTSINISNARDEEKVKENFGLRLMSPYENSQTSHGPESSLRAKNQETGRIIFRDDKSKHINVVLNENRQDILQVKQIETNEHDYEKQTSLRPYPNVDEQTTTANDDFPNVNNNVEKTGTIVQMNEDAIKEELLKEEIINNYEENIGRYKGDSFETTTQITIPVKIYEISKPIKDLVDERLSVKPLNILEKLKTTILYPVSPNYKPPKKIDVQPSKTFVRDPDDNSWRNESLSSLGIVFNPKNSSKPFTQVLKNKTETEWNNLLEKTNKNETPDLRERLEKIAEMRKTKKMKTDAYGNVLYNDYEDSNSKENVLSNENYSSYTTKPYTTSTTKFTTEITTTRPKTTITSTQALTTQKTPIDTTTTETTTKKPNKVFNVAEYYEPSDEDDADYLTMAKLDLKKFAPPLRNTQEVITPLTWPVTNNRYVHDKNDDRKPTIQYFPPLTTQKVIYDKSNDFNHKMNAYTNTEPPTNVLPVSYTKKTTSPPKARKPHIFTPILKSTYDKTLTTLPMEFAKDVYMTPAPGVTTDKDAYTFVTDDGSFNKASDVIKHYRDFLNAVAKDHDEDKNLEYMQFTKIPHQGVTLSETLIPTVNTKSELPESYEYDTDYKKDALQRFVHNFNENSERFKPNLPLLYNNSIIHSDTHGEHGRDVASSRAYLSRLLARPEADCDHNSTVELSPAYELHYYVPEQEEKEEVDPKSVTLPYQYRL